MLLDVIVWLTGATYISDLRTKQYSDRALFLIALLRETYPQNVVCEAIEYISGVEKRR